MRLSILHLEDDLNDAELVKSKLSRDGIDCDVVRVDSRAAFVSAIERGEFDLVLADYALPSFDGWTALAISREKHPDRPFLFVSGVMGEEMAIESVKRGATDYVLKQRLSRLAPAVRRALREAEDRRERKRSDERLQKMNRALRALGECNQALVRASNESDLLGRVCQIIAEVGDYPLVWVGYGEADGRDGVHAVAWSDKGLEGDVPQPVGSHWVREGLRLGETAETVQGDGNSTQADPPEELDSADYRLESTSLGRKSSLTLPMTDRGRAFGTLTICSADPGDFDEEEKKLLTRLAEDLAYGIGVLRERAAQHETQEALRSARARLQHLLTTSPAVIFSLTLVDRFSFTFVSDNITSQLGYGPHEFLEEPLVWANHIHPDDLESVLAAQEYLFDQGHLTYEYRFLHKDGTYRWMYAELRVVRDNQGLPVEVVGYWIDITGRKKAEEALRESHHRLEEAMAELQTTQRMAIQQERLRALGEMASGIAHDINNTLTPIVGYSELLLQILARPLDKSLLKEYVDLVRLSAKDAAEVVRRLRDFYRPREREELFAPVLLSPLIGQVVQMTQPKWREQALASGAAITIRTDLEDVPSVLGIESELREALTNLIFNAVDAIPAKGVITLRCRADQTHVVLEVSDSGVGMTEEVSSRCFEPFFTTKGTVGTGMGLAVVHGTIRRHDGTIEVKSEPRKGTTFRILLPILAGQTAPSRIEPQGRVFPPLRVLVVEDYPPVRQVIGKFLAADHHAVEYAENGREGLEKLRAGKFDLVITDRAMPEMSGIDLAEKIRQMTPGLPVVLLTGFGDAMHATRGRLVAVDLVLEKPFTQAELRRAITKVMTR